MKRTALLAGLAVLAASILPASAAAISDVAGNWKDPDTGAILAFADCGGDLCATIAIAAKPGMKDEQNPDQAKRSAPLEGLAILTHAKKSDDASWKGDLYNSQDGKTYSGYVTLLAPDKLQLKGCALIVFCKSLTLLKVP